MDKRSFFDLKKQESCLIKLKDEGRIDFLRPRPKKDT